MNDIKEIRCRLVGKGVVVNRNASSVWTDVDERNVIRSAGPNIAMPTQMYTICQAKLGEPTGSYSSWVRSLGTECYKLPVDALGGDVGYFQDVRNAGMVNERRLMGLLTC